MSAATTDRMEEVLKYWKEKPWVRKELGEYEEPCQDFVRKVSQLDGVIAIGVIPYVDYVDLWTVTDRRDWDLDGVIIECYGEVVRASKIGLSFDFMITNKREHLPEEAMILYEKEE